MVKSASEISEKQIRRATAAQPDYISGVQGAGADWKANALKANAKRKANLAAAEAAGKWEKRMNALAPSDWENKATNVGAGRFVEGINANKDKIDRFWNVQTPQLDALSKAISAMPEATEAEREKRLLANFQAMKKTGYK